MDISEAANWTSLKFDEFNLSPSILEMRIIVSPPLDTSKASRSMWRWDGVRVRNVTEGDTTCDDADCCCLETSNLEAKMDPSHPLSNVTCVLVAMAIMDPVELEESDSISESSRVCQSILLLLLLSLLLWSSWAVGGEEHVPTTDFPRATA